MRCPKSGFVLIIIISLMSLLAFIGLTFIQYSHNSHELSKNYLNAILINNLAHSGIQRAINHPLQFKKIHDDRVYVGEGTYSFQGDYVDIEVVDENAKININDGIKAGALEENIGGYLANVIDPWRYKSYTEYPSYLKREWVASGFINLRIRRILNAYGDAHRFVDHVYDQYYLNVENAKYYQKALPSPHPFSIDSSNSSDGPRIMPMAIYDQLNSMNYSAKIDAEKNMGFGDQILIYRPEKGYETLDEARDIINAWATHERINISEQYLNDKTFFDLIKDDLTIESFEDTEFFRLKSEGQYSDGYGYASLSKKGDFSPKSLITDPPQSDPLYFFHSHSVALINLNQASFFVKAAVFYALVNVSYSLEGASTFPPFWGNNQNFKGATSFESMVPFSSIGVSGPAFDPDLEKQENGLNQGRERHFMSLRDALHLSHAYEKYLNEGHIIYNFDDFHDFLLWHEENGEIKISSEKTIPPYERALAKTTPPQAKEGIDFNANGLFYVFDYGDKSYFSQDYARRTLPHVLSCIRRIPGYRGAPIALMSPYIVLKPDAKRDDYKNAKKECSQYLLKVEDFVWRSFQPKIMFYPGGHMSITSQATLKGAHAETLAEHTIKATYKLFETKYYRTQQSFNTITDAQTSADIKIGPEFLDKNSLNYAHKFIGFVGLHDYDKDLDSDPLVQYSPQIVMNFKPTQDLYGLENTSPHYPEGTFEAKTEVGDPWVAALSSYSLISNLNQTYNIKSSIKPIFSTHEIDSCSLSPFNGVHLSSIDHGNTVGYQFRQSLYWRLDDWLDPTHPTGQDTSAGLMTFWFRLPSGYDYVHMVGNYFPECFSRVLVSLNVWEKYIDKDLNEMKRPITLTVGIKKTKRHGQTIFARYDAAGYAHSTNATIDPIYVGAGNFVALTPSEFQTLAIPENQYDFLGFHCSANSSYVGDPPDYESFRTPSTRSSEARIPLASLHECGPGSWHRVSVGWNFRFLSSDTLESKDQLWIRLNNQSCAQSLVNPEYHQGAALAPYYDGGSGGRGLMSSFDANPVLSLGEAHGLRLFGYHTSFHHPNHFAVMFEEKTYYPYWRLDSCIDNFRFWMGASNPQQNELFLEDPQKFDDFFNPEGRIYSDQLALNNIYAAMRYNVTTVDYHGQYGIVQDNEPTWVIDPHLPFNSRLLSIGTRVYYPPDSNNNYPYVRLSLKDQKNESEIPFLKDAISPNEQDLHYSQVVYTQDTRIHLQYKAHKPKLNGDPYDIGDPLEYIGTASQGDHFTNIPWIKELSIRYVPEKGPKLMSWSE